MKLIQESKTLLVNSKILKSKTLWVNGLTFSVGIFALINNIYSPEWIVPVLAAANMVLRFVTSEPIISK